MNYIIKEVNVFSKFNIVNFDRRENIENSNLEKIDLSSYLW
jgi:hypothetical protein